MLGGKESMPISLIAGTIVCTCQDGEVFPRFATWCHYNADIAYKCEPRGIACGVL